MLLSCQKIKLFVVNVLIVLLLNGSVYFFTPLSYFFTLS